MDYPLLFYNTVIEEAVYHEKNQWNPTYIVIVGDLKEIPSKSEQIL